MTGGCLRAGWPDLSTFAAVLGIGVGAAATSAAGGDYADRDILGFAPDGRYFAFEEYGVTDAAGFVYSNIYVIETAVDAWVAGTPIRVNPRVEGGVLAVARADAHKQAQPILAKFRIGPAGRIVVSNPATEVTADPYRVRFYASDYGYQPEPAWSLTLTPLPFPDPPGCENLGPVQGFRLVLADPQGESQTLHEDAKLPSSRGCAQDYAIGDVVTFFPERGEPVIAILLYVISQGFEGPDRRFLAVTSSFAASR